MPPRYKYIGSPTRVLILGHLAETEIFMDLDARLTVEQYALEDATDMLSSSSPEFLASTCYFLAEFASNALSQYRRTLNVLNLCPRLLYLVSQVI